ncbi:MAG: type II toxin-antitoxin system VapC family toxin [Terrimicrobiaceae bacterium]|nr:type II toxin-antitoxin system VapC family toxin [Terrimicrobiaceae bacterium]
MKQPYLDTGLVLKLVIPEPLSAKVQEFLQKRGVAVPYTRLVEVELENTFQEKVFRREITPGQLRHCRDFLDALLSGGKFSQPGLSLDEVALDALEMMPKITAATGCRTLDLLHIVSARRLDCREFVTGDRRQAAAARACGLKVVEIST